MKLTRPRATPNGIACVTLDVCTCVGLAKAGTDGRFGPGRRGPAGGVCGACGCAIPSVTEQQRIDHPHVDYRRH